MRRKVVAGNWKMNGLRSDLAQLAAILDQLTGIKKSEVVLCLPSTLLISAENMGLKLMLGGQDCHTAEKGAHTGDISGEMLRDSGARYVILGHSERRSMHHETNVDVAQKVKAAWQAELTAIACVGETEAEYKAGDTLEVLANQLAESLPKGATPENTLIAYEPIWAIGTGMTPTTDEIATAHAFIREHLPHKDISILYGGSVSPANAADIFVLDDVDGGLVGGASLKAETFTLIIKALEETHEV